MAVVLPFLLFLAAAHGQVIFSNNFSGSPGNGAFPTEQTDAQWSVTGGSYQSSYTAGGSAVVSYASTQIDIAAATSYSFSTQFQVNSLGNPSSGNATTISVVLFSNTSATDAAGTTTSLLLADFALRTNNASQAVGTIRLINRVSNGNVNLDVDNLVDLNGATPEVFDFNTTYTMRVDAQYVSGTTYNITYGIYDATGTTAYGTQADPNTPSLATATYTASAEPTGGYWFGLRSRTGAQSPSATNTFLFDNVSLSVIPEPGAGALLLLSGIALVVCRRRK